MTKQLTRNIKFKKFSPDLELNYKIRQKYRHISDLYFQLAENEAKKSYHFPVYKEIPAFQKIGIGNNFSHLLTLRSLNFKNAISG